MTDVSEELAAIERTLELDAGPERVWRAITDAEELGRWFPQRAEWDLRAGGEGVFTWEGHGDFPIRVEAVDPPRYLAWWWGLEIGDPNAEEAPTLVEWWLEPREDGGTTLRLRESGFRADSHRLENDQGWTEELGELVELLA